MSDYILNLLPLKEGEREEFEAIAPEAVHVCARSSTVTSEQLAQATVIFGWPKPERMREAVRLKWFQTMWRGMTSMPEWSPRRRPELGVSRDRRCSAREDEWFKCFGFLRLR